MQAHAKVAIISVALLTLSGCAGAELDGPARKPVPRTSGAGGDPYDYTQNYGGGGAQAGKGGGSSPVGGSAGRASNAGGASSAGANGGMGGNRAGSAGTAGATTGVGASGNSNPSGAAGAGSSQDCPSLTHARVSGACVPRVTEYDVASKPTNIVLGSDRRIWVDDDDRDELVQLDNSGRVTGRVTCDPGASPTAMVGGSGDAILWYTDSHEKTLVKVNQNHEREATAIGFGASALALGGNGDVFLSEFGKAVYHLRPSQSSMTSWESSPTDVMVIGSDNNVWFSQGSALSQLVPGAGVTDFLLSETAYASGLCVGADSGLWFSDGFANQLVRVSSDGAVSRTINLPTGTAPGRIIRGPDDAFWFAETGTNMIGRVTLQGEITHYPLPTSGSMPHALTVGADGNIWFTELTSRKVGRLIPDPLP